MIHLIAKHTPFTVSSRIQHLRHRFTLKWSSGGPSSSTTSSKASGGRAGQRSAATFEEDREGVESEASVGEFFDAKGTFAADIFAKYVLSLQKTALQSNKP